MSVRRYASPLAFKSALEARLKDEGERAQLNRRRQLLVFDRFLARVERAFGERVVLKGGLVLEVRLERARTTKDIDLRISASSEDILERLQEAGRFDLGDFLSFEVDRDDRHPVIDNKAVQYEGIRFRCECLLAGKIYGQPFGVDVAFGDPMQGEPDVTRARDFLAFAGIAPPTLRLYPIATHVAEKLHAYTMPRETLNSRVRDLPDICLLASAGELKASELREAMDKTFLYRDTHALPIVFPHPSPEWMDRYARMARDNELKWATLEEATQAAADFLEPVLGGELDAVWSPECWRWETVASIEDPPKRG